MTTSGHHDKQDKLYTRWMVVQVLFFGVLRERWPLAKVNLELPDGATVTSVLQHFRVAAPELEAIWKCVAVAVNQSYASASLVLTDGDEVALLPPVSGGTPCYKGNV